MKLLYTVIFILKIIQLVGAKPSEPRSDNTLSPKKQLVRYYNKKFNLLTGDICVQLKNVTQEILKDPIVEQAASPFMQEFKTNISNFQKISPFYMRFGLNETLTWTFSNMVKDYHYTHHSNNKDAVYIGELLRTLGYEGLREKYKNDFKKFITEEFVPKFKELKDQITKKSQLTKFESKFLKCVNTLRECEEYECYLNTFKANTLTPRDKFLGSIHRHIINSNILKMENETALSKRVLEQLDMLLLGPIVQQKLKENIRDFMKAWNNSSNIYNFLISTAFYSASIYSIENVQNISLVERILFKEIAEEHITGDYYSHIRRTYGEFFKHDLPPLIKDFRASLSQQELREEKTLLDTFEDIEKKTCYKRKFIIFRDYLSLEAIQNRRI